MSIEKMLFLYTEKCKKHDVSIKWYSDIFYENHVELMHAFGKYISPALTRGRGKYGNSSRKKLGKLRKQE